MAQIWKNHKENVVTYHYLGEIDEDRSPIHTLSETALQIYPGNIALGIEYFIGQDSEVTTLILTERMVSIGNAKSYLKDSKDFTQEHPAIIALPRKPWIRGRNQYQNSLQKSKKSIEEIIEALQS